MLAHPSHGSLPLVLISRIEQFLKLVITLVNIQNYTVALGSGNHYVLTGVDSRRGTNGRIFWWLVDTNIGSIKKISADGAIHAVA
jgi:hypothetical protein